MIFNHTILAVNIIETQVFVISFPIVKNIAECERKNTINELINAHNISFLTRTFSGVPNDNINLKNEADIAFKDTLIVSTMKRFHCIKKRCIMYYRGLNLCYSN